MEGLQKKNVLETQEMGKNTSKVFSGQAESKASQEAYNETPILFSNEIKKRLPSNREYSMADIGSFKGELVNKLLEFIPEYNINTIAVDINQEALSKNNLNKKIIASAENMPFEDNSINIEIVRFVLQWNSFERQKRIIREIARTTKNFALVEHGGCDNHNPDTWRQKMDMLLDGKEIPKLKRGEHFFSSRDEIEEIMRNENIKFERIKEKTINDIADIYTERYGLNEDENKKAKDILGNSNFFIQTDWIIYPKNFNDSQG